MSSSRRLAERSTSRYRRGSSQRSTSTLPLLQPVIFPSHVAELIRKSASLSNRLMTRADIFQVTEHGVTASVPPERSFDTAESYKRLNSRVEGGLKYVSTLKYQIRLPLNECPNSIDTIGSEPPYATKSSPPPKPPTPSASPSPTSSPSFSASPSPPTSGSGFGAIMGCRNSFMPGWGIGGIGWLRGRGGRSLGLGWGRGRERVGRGRRGVGRRRRIWRCF